MKYDIDETTCEKKVETIYDQFLQIWNQEDCKGQITAEGVRQMGSLNNWVFVVEWFFEKIRTWKNMG